MNIFRKAAFYTIPIICIVIVIARLHTKIYLHFDEWSLYLLLLASIFLLVPEIENFIKSFSKIKVGNIELIISEKVKTIKDTINLISKENEIDIDEGEHTTTPYTNAYEACIAVEKEVVAINKKITKNDNLVPVMKVLYNLLQNEVIDRDMFIAIKNFFYIRNQLMHGNLDLNDSLESDIINSAVNIINLLHSINLPEENHN